MVGGYVAPAPGVGQRKTRPRRADTKFNALAVVETSGLPSEAAAVLDAHIDPALDPSGAVRVVFGKRFPDLVELDPAWTGQRRGAIFPAEEEHLGLRNAAWPLNAG